MLIIVLCDTKSCYPSILIGENILGCKLTEVTRYNFHQNRALLGVKRAVKPK